MALIDNHDAWDALQIVNACMQQIWAGVMAVYGIDDTATVVPEHIVREIFDRVEYQLLLRIDSRIRAVYRENN